MRSVANVLLTILIMCVLACCTKTDQKEVVIYTSVDQIFSEPILSDFEKNTGIKVKAVYDVEASKTVGLVNRLLSEKGHPQCDVFWNSEVGRTIFLKQKGIFTLYTSLSAKDIPFQFKDKDGYWTGFAARARVLVYNTNLLKPSDLPKSIFDLTKVQWKGKVAMGYPVFGTTATHMAALYATLGQERTETFLKALKANEVVIVDGNSVVRDMVVEGQLPIGFTDTDDVNVAIQAGKPVKMIYPDRDGLGTLLIPNTVALIHHAPHPEQGKKLIDYLLSREVESKLAFFESAQMPIRDGVKTPPHVPSFSSIKAIKVDYYDVAANIEKSDRFCQSLFIR
jgi:iron(III) transport system substrate-binding protein